LKGPHSYFPTVACRFLALQKINPLESPCASASVKKQQHAHTRNENNPRSRRQIEDQSRAAEVAVWRKVSAFLQDVQLTEGLSLRALFNDLDVNHDNVVTPEEFVKRMHTQKIFKV
jgi:hypothetical protein